MSDTTADIQAKVAETRRQLESTLDAIEDKLNVPKQLEQLVHRAQAAFDENPTPWIAGLAGAVAVVGGIVTLAILSKD